ncbi:MAG: 16S rRNA (cytosine(1402)-N(4))-methyltransferase RsmH [Gammaproteobacteria bacterium]|nr:MAG: 16S rRNA (cytosine(1402)-N(4))-methyltransferase RsmH [Gammaproteobacteria bacterium]
MDHKPVLLEDVMHLIKPSGSGVYVDCTFGRGGYTGEILKQLNMDGRVIAMDVDPDAIEFGAGLYKNEDRLVLQQENYSNIVAVLEHQGVMGKVDGVVFDLGVSSPQLDDADRGFSFRKNGPLDMRMNPDEGRSASDWVNSASSIEIERVLRVYGEEKFARRISANIVNERQKAPIVNTLRLAAIVSNSLPEKEKRKRNVHPATKAFQAIRIFINDELEQLKRGLAGAIESLAPGGVLAVVSFHSLEDRIVKRAFRRCVEGEEIPSKLPLKAEQMRTGFEYIGKLVRPSEAEMGINIRARSARLRAIRKLL